ncbi:hypothetical protein [Vannielia litorea]|uniref:Uncharacterized protein n=1 Tax=Vannielia litorea TaxID=1217970 RepID=A0A1N6HDC4_9RHOB|nr:hypothetical protein [Vannielia litorea]SIO17659.1 hypothetical protein SAMN05444002_3273 [Vannielia litorea]
MSDLAPHLKQNETLLWEGKPAFTLALPGSYVILRIAGWVMFACFLLFLLLGLANLDEMEGAVGIWITFLVISGGLWIVFALIAPAHARAANRRTRYGVTRSRAIILFGGRQAMRFIVPKTGKIERRGSGEGPWAVYFHFPAVRRVRDADGRTRTVRPGPMGFTGLSAQDAALAETALAAIRGKG